MTDLLSNETRRGRLDPSDWDQFKSTCNEVVDLMTERFRSQGQGPIWSEIPPSAISAFEGSIPSQGRPTGEIVDVLRTHLLPYTLGNTDPRFFGWVHGNGTPWGALAEFMAGAINANMGGRHHAPHLVEQQVVRWFRDTFAFPDTSRGLLVSGTSMASIVGLACARHKATEGRDRTEGMVGQDRLVGYTSVDGHISVRDAFSLLGLGSDALRAVATRDDGSLDPEALEVRIRKDLDEGYHPFVIIPNVGSVTCGAIDDLVALRTIADRHDLWVHVDGAFGAAAILAPSIASRLEGIETADSLAMDFHKWFHVPYDAGLVLVRNGAIQKATFGGRADYLTSLVSGPGSGDTWPCDLGPELSRGFRALKVWFSLQALGSQAIGEAVEENCRQAGRLASRVDAHARLERMAPADLNIVCFRFLSKDRDPDAMNEMNRAILLELHHQGIAIPSPIRRGDDFCLRVCLCNHRTTDQDLDDLLKAVVLLGEEMERAEVASAP